MKGGNFLFIFMCFTSVFSYANNSDGPQFSDYPIKISAGPFASKLYLTKDQLQATNKWISFMQKELVESVNFSGHYRIYISKNGQFLKECGNDGWVCGWIIDKITGRVVSTLPLFNGNAKYHSTTNNGTPSPDDFDITFYSNSAMMLIYGENSPPNEASSIKCANTLYIFRDNVFSKILSTECEKERGDDPVDGS